MIVKVRPTTAQIFNLKLLIFLIFTMFPLTLCQGELLSLFMLLQDSCVCACANAPDLAMNDMHALDMFSLFSFKENFEYNAFIYTAEEDQQIAEEIKEYLTNAGYKIFLTTDVQGNQRKLLVIIPIANKI